MSHFHKYSRRAAIGIAGLAVVLGAIALGRIRNGVPATPPPPPDAVAARRLRVETLKSTEAPRPLQVPRRVGAAAAPGVISKSVEPLIDSPEAHVVLSAEQRTSKDKAGLALPDRLEILKERDGLVGYSAATYGVTIGRGHVDLALSRQIRDLGQARLAYDLVDVRYGTTVLATGGDAAARASADDRTVTFARGPVEERYFLRADALEQSFVIRNLPSGSGDLTVTGRLSSNLAPPPAGSSAKLAFTAQGKDVLTVSEAVAIDATGRRRELDLAYADGKMTITVPADWLAGAVAPIVIDPLMGSALTVDSSLTDVVGSVQGVAVRVVDAAYNATSNEWLVVWQEQFGGSVYNFDIYAQRFNAAGAPVGALIPVAVTGDGEYEPTVSWASGINRYLVAWRHDPADNASDDDQFIAGRVLNSDGTFFTPSFVLDDVAGQDFGPTLAFDGTNWFCVFTNVVSATDTNVIGRFVSTDGTPGTEVALDSDSDLAAAPSVDVSGSTYLIAWQKGPPGGPNSIVGRTMSASGTLLGAITAIDTTTNDCGTPDVSAGGGQFLVVWKQTASATDHNVVGRRVTTSMGLSGNAINIRATTADQLTPRASFSTTNSFWYVVYSDTTNTDADIYGNRVDTTGKLYAANRITNVAVDEVRPELAWNSATDEMLAVYLYGAASPYQIRAQRVSMDFTAPSIPGAPVANPNPTGTGSIALSWSPIVETGGSGFSNYDLQRSVNGGATWAVIASPTTESFTDAMPQGEYVYRVRASDLAGNNSAYSPASAVVTVDNASPAEPLGLQQFRADGVTPLAVGESTSDASVVLRATIHDLGLLDGFEDSNVTLAPMWTVGSGTWGISTDGFKVLHDGTGLDDLISTPSTQTTGSWEYRFRWPTISTVSTVNLQATFAIFLDASGNGYQASVTAGAAGSKTVSLYRVDAGSPSRLVGVDGNWTPDTSFHVLRINRDGTGSFDLIWDGAKLGSASDPLYSTAVSTSIRHLTTNGNILRVDYVRMSSSPVARSSVKLQVEVKPVGTAFDGTGLIESALVASGSTVSVPVSLVNSSYHWRARAVDQLGNPGPYSVFGGNAESAADFVRIPPTPPPAAPQNLVATAGNAQVSLTWSASSGALSYTVKRATLSGGPYGTIAQGIVPAGYVDAPAQNGTTYFYVVSASNDGGESSNSSEAQATPLAPPSAPSNLSAAAANAQVSLSWSAVSGAVSYNIKRGGASGGPYGTIAATSSGVTSFVDAGLVNGATYFYVVSAANGGGESADSSQASATPLAPPAPPTGLSAQAGDRRVFLNWNVTANAVSYTLGRSVTAGGPYAVVQSGVTGTSYTDPGLVNGTRYYYVVAGVNAAGAGGNSLEAFATPTGVPVPPANLLATPRNAQVLLTWVPSAGAVSYTVRRGVNSGGPYTGLISGTTLTSYSDSAVTNGTAYFYVVTAANAAGESSNSNEAAATPVASPGAPANLVAIGGNAQAALTWLPVDGASSYVVRRAVKAGGPYAVIAPDVPQSSYMDPGLTNGVSYFYVVAASSAGGLSGDSNEAKATPTLGPPAPTNVSAARGNGQTTLTWTGSAAATGYRVKRSPVSGGPYLVVGTPSAEIFVDSPLQNGVAFFYVVSAKNDAGESPDSAEVASIPSGKVEGLVAVPLSDLKIQLSWTPLAGVAGYSVYRSLQSGGPYDRVNSKLVTAAGFLDDQFHPIDTTYYYVVRALDIIGRETEDSAEVSATASQPELFLWGFPWSFGVNYLEWDLNIFDERPWTGFEVHDENHQIVATTGLNDIFNQGYVAFYDNGLGDNQKVTRHVHPITPSGLAAPSNSVSMYSFIHDMTSGELSMSAPLPGTIDIAVTPPPNPTADSTGIRIQRRSNSSAYQIVMDTRGVYTFRDTGLQPGTLYTYQVFFWNGDGYAGGAQTRSISTIPSPVGFSGTAVSPSSINWSWQLMSAARGYVLHDASEGVIATLGPTTTSYLETGLTENTPYSRHLHEGIPGSLGVPSDPFVCFTSVHTPADGDLTLAALGATGVQVTVTPPPSGTAFATGCEISRSLNGTSWSVIRPFSNAYTFQDTGLAGLMTYWYRFRYRNGDGVPTQPSGALSVQTLAGPPAAPSTFGGTATSTSSIRWSWSEIPGAGYVLHDDAHNLVGSSSPGETSFEEVGLSENVRISRHVHAVSGIDGSGPSSTASVYTLVRDGHPEDLGLTVVTWSRIDVTVQTPPAPLSGQTGCEIVRFDQGQWVVAKPFSGIYGLSDTPLASGTVYAYRVRFQNGDGVASAYSTAQEVTTFNLPPPVITTPSKKTRRATPWIRGTAAPGETITIYYGSSADGSVVASPTGAWAFSSQLKAEGTYTVAAYGSSSGYSAPISVEVDLTPPAPPGQARVKAYSSATDVEWDPSPSADVAGYNVYRKTGQAGSWTLLNTSGVVRNTRYRDTGVTLGQTYFYRVTVIDNSVND